MVHNILENIIVPEPLQLDIAALPKGIDNYHIDIKLSDGFSNTLLKLTTNLVAQQASRSTETGNRDNLFTTLRNSYQDMMTVLIHRIKTEYSPDEISLLQFAVSKELLLTSRHCLDQFIEDTRKRSSEMRTHGSGRALDVHEHLSWLNINYNNILYSVNKQLFEQLLRVETRELGAVRNQYLLEHPTVYRQLLFNPLLMTQNITNPLLLMDQYFLWDTRPESDSFNTINQSMEALLSRLFPEIPLPPLKSGAAVNRREIHDGLGGFQALQNFLGSTHDSGSLLKEEFCWLDNPANVRFLFDHERHRSIASNLRQSSGWKAWWQYRRQIKRLERARRKIIRLLGQQQMLRSYLASEQIRQLRSRHSLRQINPGLLLQFFCGQISQKQLKERSVGTSRLEEGDIELLEQSAAIVLKELKTRKAEAAENALLKLSHYRQDLKYLRFAHRAFNRIRLLGNEDEVMLSRHSGKLYQLPLASEVEEKEASVVHHTILKADVRGSTTVIDEMDRQNLNAASFFSLRFFGPINKVLADYGANKVFIEGDAIILSFLEYEHCPHQWFSVAHACGLARTLLRIVNSQNQLTRQMNLPPLELGIGICYSDTGPCYLFDEDRPIMISSAIGLADRNSSCSWRLRSAVDPSPFNVQVLELAKSQQEHGEKGQELIRYNVNGILLENSAFEKLRKELDLKRVKLRIGDQTCTCYHASYHDLNGRDRGLLIREGIVDLWQDNTVQPRTGPTEYFYEVVSNSQIYTQAHEHLTGR